MPVPSIQLNKTITRTNSSMSNGLEDKNGEYWIKLDIKRREGAI